MTIAPELAGASGEAHELETARFNTAIDAILAESKGRIGYAQPAIPRFRRCLERSQSADLRMMAEMVEPNYSVTSRVLGSTPFHDSFTHDGQEWVLAWADFILPGEKYDLLRLMHVPASTQLCTGIEGCYVGRRRQTGALTPFILAQTKNGESVARVAEGKEAAGVLNQLIKAQEFYPEERERQRQWLEDAHRNGAAFAAAPAIANVIDMRNHA